MSEVKSPSKGSVLSNLEPSTDDTDSPKIPRSPTPEEIVAAENKDDQSISQKDGETEGKKRKRSQRACIRCRGQKLKCDGVFPCARCIKLKLVCKEPSDVSSATPGSSKFSSDERESKGAFSTPSSRPSSHLHSNTPLSAGGLPAPACVPSSAFALPAPPDHVRADRSRSIGSYAASYPIPPPSDSSISDRSSLPDAVRRIESLERTVSRLVDHVESPGRRSAPVTERKRMRPNSPDDSDAEVDELAQDGQSDASMAQHRAAPDGHIRHIRPSISNSISSIPESPVDAGLVTPDIAQSLLESFSTCCHVFAPFLDVEELNNLPALSSTEPFLLSVVLAIAALYQDPQAKSETAFRREFHSRLSSHVTGKLGHWLCRPTPSITTVQAVLLIAYWPQAFPDCPDDRLLVGYASGLLQSVALQDQLNSRSVQIRYTSQSARISTLWTSLRAFEAVAAFDSGRPMHLSDQDVALSKAPRPARSSIPTAFAVRAIPVLKECQIRLSELSLSSLLPVSDPVKPPLPRANLSHDWDRFNFAKTQLVDIEKRWLGTETDSNRLERIIGLIDRWGIHAYQAILALKSIELSLSSRPNEETGRFLSAYRREIFQACQVMMDIFTDPEVSGALQYAPGYHIRRFAQATTAAAALLDFHDPGLVRSTQELIYMCTKRLDQLSQATFTPYIGTLLSYVKYTYDKCVSANHPEGNKNFPPPAPSGRHRDSLRWTTTDVFTIFFGIGLVLNE